MNLRPNVAIITDLNPLILFFVIIVTKGSIINCSKKAIKLNDFIKYLKTSLIKKISGRLKNRPLY